MTLPQPDKPVITDLVSNIVAYTKENLDYLDANRLKQHVTLFSRNAATASSTDSITGVGFEPSSIIFFAVLAGGGSVSFGVYGLSSGATNNCVFKTSAGEWSYTGRCLKVGSSGSHIEGYVSATGSDGFDVTFIRTATPTGTDHVAALCIR